jgi:hypothetical protein
VPQAGSGHTGEASAPPGTSREGHPTGPQAPHGEPANLVLPGGLHTVAASAPAAEVWWRRFVLLPLASRPSVMAWHACMRGCWAGCCKPPTGLRRPPQCALPSPGASGPRAPPPSSEAAGSGAHVPLSLSHADAAAADRQGGRVLALALSTPAAAARWVTTCCKAPCSQCPSRSPSLPRSSSELQLCAHATNASFHTI